MHYSICMFAVYYRILRKIDAKMTNGCGPKRREKDCVVQRFMSMCSFI